MLKSIIFEVNKICFMGIFDWLLGKKETINSTAEEEELQWGLSEEFYINKRKEEEEWVEQWLSQDCRHNS